MAGQKGDKISGTSSIALLQERFRHLQRMREKREEKEHHRLIYPEPDNTFTMPGSVPFEQSNINFHKDPNFPSRSSQQEASPLHLGLELHNKHANSTSFKNTASLNLWSNNAALPASTTAMSPSYNYDKWDVDTSLHL
ncbi:hypothetical protein DCAR_0522534 [Daucus carota subsp. sativus]|uniref:Uncharacterized protein n=1 Tax=Daucus carota subsp. sativus TaxID=79200 RepID=A0A164ZVB4_DAUCS|nr:hypothetical protein DCAR_0522534 [Daucus carota subsp. sativus]